MTPLPRTSSLVLLVSAGAASALALGLHERSARALSCAAPPAETLQLELVAATVDDAPVADTPPERRTAALRGRGQLVLADGTSLFFTRESR